MLFTFFVGQPELNRPVITFRRPTFSLLGMLGLMTVIALITIQNSWWATVFAIELIALHFFVNALVKDLPTTIREVMSRNCYRMDHLDANDNPNLKLDALRTSKEQSKLNQLYKRLFLAVLLVCAVPLNLMLLCLESGTDWLEWAESSSPFEFGIVMIMFGVGLIASFFLAQSAYLHYLERLFDGARYRREKYFDEDLAGKTPNPFAD